MISTRQFDNAYVKHYESCRYKFCGIYESGIKRIDFIFGFDIADVSGSIRLFSDVMKRLGIKKDGDEMYEEFQKIYDESVGRDTDKKKVEDRTQNMG